MSVTKGLNEKECIQVNQAIFSLRNIYESRMRRENGKAKDSLGIGEIGVLMVIGQMSDVTAQELARLMDLTRGTISIYVKRLVALGLATQTRSDEDKRNWHLNLTKKGFAIYESAYAGTVEYTRDIISILNHDEQRAFHGILVKLAHGNGYDWQ